MRLPRVQFSVRLLLVLVLALGSGLGWLAHKARTQRWAVAQIKRLGGSVIYDFQEVTGVPSDKMEPRGPRWLRGLIGDELFQEVAQVNLSGLDLRGVDLAWLESFPELQTLNLICAEIGDTGLARLCRLKLKRLRVLWLADCGISDSGLACLAGFDRLENLEVSYNPVTDAGLNNLRHLGNLETLSLVHTPIDGSGLAYLKGLRRLKFVDLRGSKASDEARTELMKAVPGVNVQPSWAGAVEPLSRLRAEYRRRR
jgi:hypothetical protein